MERLHAPFSKRTDISWELYNGQRYVTCQLNIGFLLFTFPMSYFISSTFHPPLQHLPLNKGKPRPLSSSWSPSRQPLLRKRTRQTEHTDGQRQHRSTERRTDSRSYSSHEESRNCLDIQSLRYHERNDDPRHELPRDTPGNPQQRHRQNVNQARRPKRCLTVGWLATSKESADNPDKE